MFSKQFARNVLISLAVTIVFMAFVIVTKEASLLTFRLPEHVPTIAYLLFYPPTNSS
jgi:hypothetical protein